MNYYKKIFKNIQVESDGLNSYIQPEGKYLICSMLHSISGINVNFARNIVTFSTLSDSRFLDMIYSSGDIYTMMNMFNDCEQDSSVLRSGRTYINNMSKLVLICQFIEIPYQLNH